MRGFRGVAAAVAAVATLAATASPAFASSVSTSGSQLVFTGTSSGESIRMQQVAVTFPDPVGTTSDNVRIDQQAGTLSQSGDCVEIPPRAGYDDAAACSGIATVSATFAGGNDSSEVHGLADGSPFPFPISYSGGTGIDELQSGGAADTIDGGSGINDWVTFRLAGPAVNANLVTGDASGQGADTLTGIEHAIGTILADTLRGDGAANALAGNLGNDEIFGEGAADGLIGDAGQDDLHGGPGDDDLFGQNDFDSLFGEAGDDELEGGAAVDELSGGPGDDQLEGGPAGEPGAVDYLNLIDETADVRVDLAAGTMSGPGLGSDTLSGLELILSGSGDDVLIGDDKSNLFVGGRGRDLIVPRGGEDTIVGDDLDDQNDPGVDTVSYADAPSGVTVDMGEGAGNGTATGDGTDSLAWHDGENPTIENVVGSAQADIVFGDFDRNRLDGRGGNDDVSGDAGPDTLLGGSGRDDLSGQDGDDVLLGQAGPDRGFGGRGGDRFFGGAGADRGIGGPGPDRLLGQVGQDFLAGNRHRDFLIGGPGADIFLGGLGNDVLRARDDRRDLRIACQAGRRDTAILDLRPRDPSPTACEFVRRR